MKITLQNLGKRYNREWIFRHIEYEFIVGKKYAITGSNGSGKSTLLQVIAGSLMHNEGSVEISSQQWAVGSGQLANTTKNKHQTISNEQHYQYISIATPYLELIEEMTAIEMLRFHSTFKQLILPAAEILQIVNLQASANKQIRYYSSGMKQRVKLAQAFFSNTSVLLLDEPCTNLDKQGIELYRHLIKTLCKQRLVLICSNDSIEYESCSAIVSMSV